MDAQDEVVKDLVECCSNLIDDVQDLNEEVFIIGGASIYKYFLPYCKKLYLTEVNDSKNANVYFPRFDKNLYTKNTLHNYIENNISYKIIEYTKK